MNFLDKLTQMGDFLEKNSIVLYISKCAIKIFFIFVFYYRELCQVNYLDRSAATAHYRCYQEPGLSELANLEQKILIWQNSAGLAEI